MVVLCSLGCLVLNRGVYGSPRVHQVLQAVPVPQVFLVAQVGLLPARPPVWLEQLASTALHPNVPI